MTRENSLSRGVRGVIFVLGLLLSSCSCDADPHELSGKCSMAFFTGAGTCHYAVQLVETEPRDFYISTQDDHLDLTATITVGEGEVRVALLDYNDEAKREVTVKAGTPGVLQGSPWIGPKPDAADQTSKWYPLTMQAVGGTAKNVVVDIEFKVDTKTDLKPHR